MEMQSNNFISKYLSNQQQRINDSQYKPLREVHAEDPSLKSIHDKLQEETDKIVKWKVSTEVSLNQKERQLNDCQKVIDTLRTNLFEQQMKSESLSQNLLREKGQREQIEEHAFRTRNLCDALIHRYEELDVVINEYADNRQHFESFNEEVKNQIFNLSENFKNLTTKHENNIKKLEFEAESEISELNRNIANMKDYIFSKETEFKDLQEESVIKSMIIEEFGQKFFILEEKLECQTAKHNWTLNRLGKTEKTFSIAKQLSENRLFQLETLNEELESNLKTSNEKLRESILEFEEAAEKVKYLQEFSSSLEESRDELLAELKALQNLKEETENETALKVQKMEEMISFSYENEKMLKTEILNLGNSLSSIREEFHEKKIKYDDLLKSYEKERDEFIQIEKTLKQYSESQEEIIRTKNNEIESLVKEVHQAENKCEQIVEEKDSVLSEVVVLQKSNADLKEALTIRIDNVAVLEKENSILKCQIEEQTSHLQEIIENEKNLSSTNNELSKEISELKEDISKLQSEKKEMEKINNSGNKNLTFELKKNKKLKARLQNLESKLIENESSSKLDNEKFGKTIENLRIELQETKNSYEESKLSYVKLNEELESTKNNMTEQLEKTKMELKAAENEAEENARKVKMAENEANAKVREMLELSEIFKKESEIVIDEKTKENSELKKEIDQVRECLLQTQQAQDVLLNMKSKLEETIRNKNDEILSIDEKLSNQTKEFGQLKAAIKSLTGSPKKCDDLESLRTPSPSEYLPLYQCNVSSDISNEDLKSQNRKSLRPKIPLKSHSILKQNTHLNERQGSKTVSFLSPVFRAPDSDSSDGFAVDIQSDTDDKFEAIRRSSNVRYCRPVLKRDIPKANITPLRRASSTEGNSERKENGNKCSGSFKRPRYDKTALKTYTSPKSKNT